MGATIDDTLMRDIVGWDVRTWSTAVEFWDGELDSSEPLQCMEIGAGPGGPSLWLALQGHTVLCTNFQNTRGQAEPLHKRYGVTGVTYEDVDATRIPFENRFDLIIFKSVLGGVGSDLAAQQELKEQTGLMFVVKLCQLDYLAPARLDDELQLRMQISQLGRASMTFAQTAWRGQQLLVSAEVKVVCVQSQTMKPQAIPDFIRQQLKV